jgi:hypothetical protein
MSLPNPIEALALKDIISPLISAGTTLIAAVVAYQFAKRQLHKKAQIDLQEDLRKRRADALQTAWALLQSLSPTDNGRNCLHYVQAKKPPASGEQTGTKPERHYQMQVANAQAYVFEHLPAAFYASGAGLHWSRELKDKFFECRTLLYGYLLAEQLAHAPASENQSQNNPLRPINKPELPQRIEALYHEINALLRKEIQSNYGY